MSGPPIAVGEWLTSYDFELPLRDAIVDPELDPVRRALATLAIGTALDDGHFAAGELLEAAEQLARDREAETPDGQGRGATELRRILDAPCDDYQRALWFAVRRLPLDGAVAHLQWLTNVMYARARMFRAIQASGAMMPLLPGSEGDCASYR